MVNPDAAYQEKTLDYFQNVRGEILPLLPEHAARIFEVGCGSGDTLSFLKKLGKCDWAGGIELFHDAAETARTKVDLVLEGSIEKAHLPFEENTIDIILCLDDIRNFKITLVVASALADLLSCFAHAYGKKTGLPVVHPVGARMGRNLCLSTTPNTGPYRYAEIYQSCYASFSENNELARPVREYIHQYISKRRQPHYVQGASSLLFRILSLADLGIMWKLWKLYLQDRYGLHYTTFPLWVPFQRVRRVYRAVMYSWFLRRHEINLEYLKERRYVIYPIHFHPEASTLVQGRFFNDQVRIVEMVSKALPADVTLVVKEHKVNVGRNPIGFYRKFLNFHNVRFITDKVSVYELINNAVGLVTICSSMGLEAMMCKKPVMVFGDVHYNLSKNVIRATDFTKMGAYFDDLVSHKFDEIDLWALIETTRSQMFETGDLNPDSKEAVHALAGAIVRFGSNP